MNHRSFPFAWAWLADSRFATGPSRRVPWPTPPPVTGLVFGARAAPRPGLRSRGGRLFWVAGVTGLTLRGDVELFARKRGAALPSRSRTAGAPGTRVCALLGGVPSAAVVPVTQVARRPRSLVLETLSGPGRLSSH